MVRSQTEEIQKDTKPCTQKIPEGKGMLDFLLEEHGCFQTRYTIREVGKVNRTLSKLMAVNVDNSEF